MLPIVRFPRIVEQHAPWVDPVFATDEQRKHFREYVTGLIAGDEATVTAINNLFLERNDQSALNKFLTQAEWDEMELNRRRVQWEVARLQRRPVSAEAGRLVIDDTLAHHTRCRMDWLASLRDHAEGRSTWAHDVVTSDSINRADQFPVDFRLWYQFRAKQELRHLGQATQVLAARPTVEGYRQPVVDLLGFHVRQQLYRSKTALGADLVRGAVDLGLPCRVVVFESWFLPNELLDVVEAAHKDWVGGCPTDRLVLGDNQWTQWLAYLKTIPSAAYRPTPVSGRVYWTFTKVLTVKSLRRRRIRIVASFDNPDLKGEPGLLASNRKDWERTRILLTYGDRWPTETCNEDVKGHLGFEDYQRHTLRGIRRHCYLGFAGYALLGDHGHPGRSRHGVRAPFESTGQRCRGVADEVLGHLVEGMAQRLAEGVPTTTIVQTLLA